MGRRRVTRRVEAVVAVSLAAAACAFLATSTLAAPLRSPARNSSNSSALSSKYLDGSLYAAGTRACQYLPVAMTSIAQLSCRALQQTVQSGPYPGLWQMSQVLSATLTGGGVMEPAGVRQQYDMEVYATLNQYADGLSFSSGLTPVAGNASAGRFYDDNAWAGLDLIQAYEQGGQSNLLQAAEEIYTFEQSGEWRNSDPPDQHRFPGGIYWNTFRRTRPTTATAGAAQVALELYKLTHHQNDLAFGEQEYQWVRQTLGTSKGLYRERVEPQGTITGTSSDSGQGLMIGDGVLLYEITGQKQYLEQARQTAEASLALFTPSVTEATCPASDAIFFYNVMNLKAISPVGSYTRLLKAYAAWATRQSNPQTGAFPLAAYGTACHPPLPQAGVTRAVILQASG